MDNFVEQVYGKASTILAQAKQNRNWGAIGSFHLPLTVRPEIWNDNTKATMRAACENAFVKAGEPGIIILFIDEPESLRVHVSRTNENE